MRNIYPMGDGSKLCETCLRKYLEEAGEPNNITCGKEVSDGLPVYGWVSGECSDCKEVEET